MHASRFRLPGRTRPISAWLAALFPDVPRSARRAWVDAGRVHVDGALVSRGTQDCAPGSQVEIDSAASEARSALEAAEAALPRSRRFAVWIDDPPWTRGTLSLGKEEAPFEVDEREDGVARLVVEAPRLVDGGVVLAALAAIGLPAVGDLARGGLGWPGGARLVALAASRDEGEDEGDPGAAARIEPEAPFDSIPVDPAWRWDHDAETPPSEDETPETSGRLMVSRETARILAAGHAWVRPDAASDPAARYRPGALVEVVDREGRPVGFARTEGAGALGARVWSGPGETPASIESRVARAIGRRRGLIAAEEETNAFRLIHGEADGLPGLFVDRLGPLWRVLISGYAALGFRDAVLEALTAQWPVTASGTPWQILELLHLRSPARDRVERVRWRRGDAVTLLAEVEPSGAAGFVVRERGLRFEIDPGWDAPHRPRPGFGLFVDQRENRERLAQVAAAQGGRWLNLFAHTGAFSVALLAAGAESVVSVDLSAPYLERIDRNLALNAGLGDLAARHRTLRGDARRALENEPGDWRGMVIDPPTAAAAGRRFWSVREDLEPLLRAAIDRLGDGGTLLVTQNRAGPPLGLDSALERVARRAHRAVEQIEPAPPGRDHPSIAGFPEGAPFEGWLLTLR